MRPSKRGQSAIPSYVRNKVYIAWSDAKILAPADRNASAFRYWRSFTRWEWSLVQHLIGGLARAYIWQNWSDELEQEIIQLMYPQEPPATECPEPEPEQPPPTPPGGAGGGASSVGSLGLSIEELEGLLMGSIMDIRIYQGKLQVQYFPCCDWVDVGNLTTIYGTPGESSTTSPGELGVDEWLEGGQPPVEDMISLPHQNPIYTTMDSLKCAKATAIVNEIWNVLTIGDAVEEAGDIATLVGNGANILTFLLNFQWKWTTRLGWVLATSIFNLVTGTGLEEYAEELQAVHANTTAKEILICDLVPRMTSPVQIGILLANVMTADDVRIALERFEVVVPHHVVVRKTLGIFPISSWQEVVSAKVVSTECGCEQYLPYGYNPPFAEGVINFVRFVNNGSTTTVSPAGLPFEVLVEEPRQGIQVGSDFETTYAGIVMGSGNRVYHRCAMLFYCETPVRIQEVRMTATPIGNVGTANFDANVRVFETVGGWAGGLQPATLDVPGVIAVDLDKTGQWIYVALKVDDLAAPDIKAGISNILFTGEISGAGFFQKGIGEQLV